MKKKSTYIIIALLVLLIILSVGLLKVQNQKIQLQDSIDSTFKAQLSNALSNFSVEVNDYTYRSMVSSVYNAAILSELTSYEEINDSLDISLYNLFISLREDKSKSLVLSKIDEIRKIFFELVQDPTDKKTTDQISQIVSDTFFNNAAE
ncbi:hypothetical protein [Cohnella yongneupensis]|uniref:Uncharacterized protein n=1 Tax=Cohnella yongneupensis TaxID=425006 RepID=A0ABW0QZG0_9BACL